MAMKSFTVQIDESLIPEGYEPDQFKLVRVDRSQPKVMYLGVGETAGSTVGSRMVEGRKSDGPRLTFKKLLTPTQKLLKEVASYHGNYGLGATARGILQGEGVSV